MWTRRDIITSGVVGFGAGVFTHSLASEKGRPASTEEEQYIEDRTTTASAAALLELTNRHRRDVHGGIVNDLSPHDGLKNIASARAQKMAAGGESPELTESYINEGIMSQSENSGIVNRIESGLEAAVGMRASDGTNAETVFEAWLGDPLSKRAIEDTAWSNSGVAVVVSDGDLYAVQNFL